MDITEAFRSEDLTKADFFDFVVTPDNATDVQTLQQFTKQMRTVNAFLGNTGTGSSEDGDNKEANNNNSTMVSNAFNNYTTKKGGVLQKLQRFHKK